jgi:hypothetical protein
MTSAAFAFLYASQRLLDTFAKNRSQSCTGAIASYNASVVKIYSANNSMARFLEQRLFWSDVKNALAYHNAGVVAANSKVVHRIGSRWALKRLALKPLCYFGFRASNLLEPKLLR